MRTYENYNAYFTYLHNIRPSCIYDCSIWMRWPLLTVLWLSWVSGFGLLKGSRSSYTVEVVVVVVQYIRRIPSLLFLFYIHLNMWNIVILTCIEIKFIINHFKTTLYPVLNKNWRIHTSHFIRELTYRTTVSAFDTYCFRVWYVLVCRTLTSDCSGKQMIMWKNGLYY